MASNISYLVATDAPHVALNLPRSLHKEDNAHSLLTVYCVSRLWRELPTNE